MDRRRQKSRAAIFSAFSKLLGRKNYAAITIGEIIEGANVGRSTFYAHFATKDELLFALCTQIVEHVLEGADKKEAGDVPLGDGIAGRLEHILWHVEANGETIRHILSSEGERAFTRYFEEYLEEIFGGAMTRVEGAREDYALNAAVSAFSQTVRWWLTVAPKLRPREVMQNFAAVYGNLIQI